MLKFKIQKKTREIKLPNKRAFLRMGREAFMKIRKRVKNRGIQADGKPVPSLARNPKKTWSVAQDHPTIKTGNIGVHFWNWKTRLLYTDYGQAKRRSGRKAIKDGFLTGGLWRQPGLKIVKLKKVLKRGRQRMQSEYGGNRETIFIIRQIEHAVAVYFAGSSRTDTRSKGKVKKKVSNRIKSKAVGRTKRRDKKPAWHLLQLSPAEFAEVVRKYRSMLAN